MDAHLSERVITTHLDQIDELKQQNSGKPIFYGNPICPFAHRAWMTIVAKGVEHNFVLIPLSGELSKMQAGGVSACVQWENSGKTVEQIQKIKDDYKANVNSTGEVPTLVYPDQIISEADVVSEFLDDAYKNEGVSLFPADAFQRSKIRHYFKVLSGSLGVSACYGMLKNQDPAADAEKLEKLYRGLQRFCEMADEEGPFFLGKEICFADVMLAPFYDRFRYTLKTYRGVEFIPTDQAKYPWAARLLKWAKAVEETASFQATAQDKSLYINSYKSYAGDRGASKFGA